MEDTERWLKVKTCSFDCVIKDFKRTKTNDNSKIRFVFVKLPNFTK